MTLRESRPRSETPTLHDVAREAGVSLATASRVLNGSARKLAESFRERVEEARLGREMARLGYRQAIAIGAAEGVRTSDDRLSGFQAGFATGGGTVSREYRGSFARESGASSMAAALADGVEPGTLVFALSDVIAIGAMTTIRDAGRSVGEDIAMCGFDDIPVSRDVTPQLTTVRVPLIDFGYQAFRATVDDEWQQTDAPLEVLVRASTPGLSNTPGRVR